MGSTGIGALSFTILALIFAIIFSPLGTGINSSCSLSSSSNCALQFNTQATIVLSTNGYSLYNATYQTCQNITGVNNVPVLGYLANLPILSNVYDLWSSFSSSLYNLVVSSSSATIIPNICSQQSGNILVFHYTGQDLVFLLIGVIMASGAIAALTGISFIGNGQNSAGTYIVFMISSLGLLWLVLSSFALPTFTQMPVIIGGTLWTFLTVMYAFGMIDIIS